MTPVGFEPTISPGELPQTYKVDRVATGTCFLMLIVLSKLITQKKLYTSELKEQRLDNRTKGKNNVRQRKAAYRSELDTGSGITKRTVECSLTLGL